MFRGGPARARVGAVCAAWGGGAGCGCGRDGGQPLPSPPRLSRLSQVLVKQQGRREGRREGHFASSRPRGRGSESRAVPREYCRTRGSRTERGGVGHPLPLPSTREQLGAPRTGCPRWMRGDSGRSSVPGQGCLGRCEARSGSLRDGAAAPLTVPKSNKDSKKNLKIICMTIQQRTLQCFILKRLSSIKKTSHGPKQRKFKLLSLPSPFS